jgi:SAM-dependent methyltransferase
MELSAKYIFEEGIYVNKRQNSFGYSDGDQIEDYLLEIIQSAQDVSIGSEELALAIKDWPTLYHFSPRRADLLRPFTKELKGKKILEVGSECGAITRFLGELGAEVLAIEGSLRRAKITASRCRDLKNVTVVCDNFEGFESPENFDYVTLIGVLEYSNLYISSDDPAGKMLQTAKRFIKKSGSLLIAIENKLGLKYWAGAPEDHLGVPYFGIENKYNSSTAVTFGKQEIKNMLEKAGYLYTRFLYPFPDYKLPEVIITEKGFEQGKVNINNLLVERFDYMQSIFYTNKFSTTLAAKSLQDNYLLEDFANSFLIITHINEQVQKIDEHSLSYIYSTIRKKKYCKENIIIDNAEHGLKVIRNYIYKERGSDDGIIKNVISNEKYINGNLLFRELIPIVSRIGWKVADLNDWAAKYYAILKKQAYEKENQLWLDGRYLDLTPFNIIVADEHDYTIFDQEWVCNEDIPIYYVLFRGLVFSLERIRYYESPDETTPYNILEITEKVIREFLPFTDEHLADCKQREKKLFSTVALGNADPFLYTTILTRINFELKSQSLQTEVGNLKCQLDVYKEENENVKLALDQANEKNQFLIAENNNLNSQLQKSLQCIIQQESNINSNINYLIQVNYALHTELKRKEENLNRMFNEIINKMDTLVINETLNVDKVKLQQEVEWYKRTYEKRSILGLIKEKLMRKH